MSVSTTAAQISDRLLVVTIFLYTLAMLGYAAELAYGRTIAPKRTRSAEAPEAELVLAGVEGKGAAGGPDAAHEPDTAEGRPEGDAAPGGLSLGERAGSIALALTGAGLLTHVSEIVARGLAVHRVPWGNLCEFMVAITCGAVLVFLYMVWRHGARFAGLFVTIPVVLGLGLAMTVLYVPAGPVMPALQSYWLVVHVTAAAVSSSVFIVGATATVLYLIVDRYERLVAAGRKAGASAIARRLPGSVTFDRLSYRTIVFAFPVWTFTIIAGAIWADQAWGRYWGWDPTETWAFITWVVFAGYLHARVTAGWRGRKAAYIHLLGFACLLTNLFVVNIFVNGFHSYSGLN